MRKILFTATLVLMVIVGYAATPKLPSKCEVGLPEVLTHNLIKESEAMKIVESSDLGQNSKTERFWIAYSDRTDNTTYEAASLGSPKCDALAFNESVRIAKIQDGFALVYHEPQKTVEYPNISKDAVCKGWIPVEKLLLWQSCLTSEQGILNKALLCINLDGVGQGSIDDVGVGYYTPTKSVKAPGRLQSGTKFYYVMKREKGMTLLASESKMDGLYTDKVLSCWIADNSYVPWNQRSCLEPTWEYEDAEYFAAKNIQINVYASQNTDGTPAASFSAYKSIQVPEGEQRLYAHRMDSLQLRYPVLDGNTDQLYHISSFGTQGENSSNVTAAQIEADEMMKKNLEKMSNINLAIVIDGTGSMKDYYPEVKEAIKQGCQYFGEKTKIKVGVVIYRDYGDGDALTEVLPLTPLRNINNVNEFLDNGGKMGYGIRSAKADLTEEEALYYGINKALDTLRFRDGESNMLLVVGDCGNDVADKKIDRAEIVKKLVDKKISIMGFQVQNKANSAYDAFNSQMTSIINESLKKVYHNLDATVKIVTKRVDDGYDYTSSANDNFYFGRYLCADVTKDDGKMAPGKLCDLMSKQILTFSQVIDNRINAVMSVSGFIPDNSTNPSLVLSEQFIKAQYGADYDKYKALIEKTKQLVSFRGYTPREDASGRNYFKPVVFISEAEFANLLKSLEQMYRIATTEQYKERKPYQTALKALIKSIDGGITDQELNSLTNAQITQMIGGLNEAPESLKRDYTIEDLANEQVVSEGEYRGIVREFKNKYDTLNTIKSSKKYPYTRLEPNGTKYYWLPIEVLP